MKSSDSSKQLREKLKSLAQVPQVLSNIPILRYYELLRQFYIDGRREVEKKSYEGSFIYFTKFLLLFLQNLPNHADFKLPIHAKTKANFLKISKFAFEHIEDIKVELDALEDERLMKEHDLFLMREFDELEDGSSSNRIIVDIGSVNMASSIEASSNGKISQFDILRLPGSDNKPSSSEIKFSDIDKKKLDLLRAPYDVELLPKISIKQEQVSTTDKTDSISSPNTSNSFTDVYNNLNIPTIEIDDEVNSFNSSLSIVGRMAILSNDDLQIMQYIKNIRHINIPSFHSFIIEINLTIHRQSCVVRLKQEDFQTSYQPFLTTIPPLLQMTACAVEANRCFFIHLGLAVGIHPFSMQTAFRQQAKLLNSTQSDDLVAELLTSLFEYAGLVDANALIYLWPREFADVRLCMISGDLSRPIISVFEMSNIIGKDFTPSGSNIREVMMRCNGCHFTLLSHFDVKTPNIRSKKVCLSKCIVILTIELMTNMIL